MTDLSRLSINQETIKQWSLPELAEGCVKAGIDKVGLWRAPVQEYGVERTAQLLTDAGIFVTSLCRGGFFTALDPAERARALDDNRAAIDEAAALSTDTLVLVSGGLPAGSRDLPGARERIAEALAELGPYAQEQGVRLAIEPLHPMFASDRCVVSTLSQALDIAERFPAEQVGVVVDTYHIWWDDQAAAQIARAGAGGRIHSFQLADWITRSRRAYWSDGANSATEASTSAHSARWSRPPASPGRSRWRSSTRACGRGTAPKFWRRSRPGTSSTPAESGCEAAGQRDRKGVQPFGGLPGRILRRALPGRDPGGSGSPDEGGESERGPVLDRAPFRLTGPDSLASRNRPAWTEPVRQPSWIGFGAG